MTNKKAVALNYDEEKYGVPRIVAVGEGQLAQRILELAQAHEVPVVEDRVLVGKLAKFPVGAPIPPELFEAVAKVLAFLYRLEKEKVSP